MTFDSYKNMNIGSPGGTRLNRMRFTIRPKTEQLSHNLTVRGQNIKKKNFSHYPIRKATHRHLTNNCSFRASEKEKKNPDSGSCIADL